MDKPKFEIGQKVFCFNGANGYTTGTIRAILWAKEESRYKYKLEEETYAVFPEEIVFDNKTDFLKKIESFIDSM